MTTDDAPVVLVTGAGSGIGAATALAFAKEGWTVYATDVETPLPDRVARRCRCRELDVTSDEQCHGVVEDVLGETGRLDCLVNNAGYAVPGPVEDVSVDAVREGFDVLVHGPHRLYQAVLPEMRERGGRLVTISSVLAHDPYPGLGGYSAGKAAVSALTGALRRELVDTPVQVALVEPSWVQSKFAEHAKANLGAERTPAYEAVYESLEDGWVLDGGPLAIPPEAVAATVVEAATEDDPSARYPVGQLARMTRWTEWLPEALTDRTPRAFGRVTARLDGWL